MGDDDGLRCPACNSAFSEVTNTIKYENMIRRYRKCVHCGKRWPTTELSNRPKPEKKKPDVDDEFFVLDDDLSDF